MDDLRDKYLTAIMAAEDEVALEDLRLQAVGKKGEVSLKMRELGKMTPEQRQSAGPKLNALKNEINIMKMLRHENMACAMMGLEISLHTHRVTSNMFLHKQKHVTFPKWI